MVFVSIIRDELCEKYEYFRINMRICYMLLCRFSVDIGVYPLVKPLSHPCPGSTAQAWSDPTGPTCCSMQNVADCGGVVANV